MAWTGRHPEAFLAARKLCHLDSGAAVVTAVVIAIVAISGLWFAAGPTEAWSQTIGKVAATAAILLVFPGVYLWYLFDANSFIRRRATMLLVTVGLALLVVGTVVFSVGLSRAFTDRGSAVIPEHALKAIDTLSKQLEERATPTASPEIARTGDEIVSGPYQPEEVREMILALGKMYEISVKGLAPAVATLNQVMNGNWPEKWSSDPQAFILQLEGAHKSVAGSFRELHLVVFEENVRFSEELRTTIADPRDTANRLDAAAIDAIETMKILAKAPKDLEVRTLIQRSLSRITMESMGPLLKLINDSVQRTQKKQARLRAYKS